MRLINRQGVNFIVEILKYPLEYSSPNARLLIFVKNLYFMCISPIQYTRQFVVYALLISSFLLGCNNERVDTHAVVQEMRDRQIKRVNPAQVMALADDWGKNIAKQLKKNAATTLLNNQLKDSLSKAYAANIQFLSPPNFDLPSLAELERQVLDAYQYSANKKLPQSDNIQRLPDQQTLLFTAPVLWNDDFTKLSKAELTQLSQKFQLDSL